MSPLCRMKQSKMSTEMAIGFLAALLAHVNPEDMANLYQGASYTQMGILNNRYSEAAERDADHGGALIMAKAGFNPVGMLTFMQRLAAQEQLSPNVELGILRDHPYTGDRVGAIQQELGEMKVAVTPQAIRAVSNGPKAAVVPLDHAAVKIVFAGQTLATIADPDGDRAQKAAALLNSLLDLGLAVVSGQSRERRSRRRRPDRPDVHAGRCAAERGSGHAGARAGSVCSRSQRPVGADHQRQQPRLLNLSVTSLTMARMCDILA